MNGRNRFAQPGNRRLRSMPIDQDLMLALLEGRAKILKPEGVEYVYMQANADNFPLSFIIFFGSEVFEPNPPDREVERIAFPVEFLEPSDTDSTRLTFNEVSRVNLARCLHWHKGDFKSWNAADWSNALNGEGGELTEAILDLLIIQSTVNSRLGIIANGVKKLRRFDDNVAQVTGPKSIEEALAIVKKEIGDVYIYLDILAQYLGFSTEDAIRETFNRVSERESLPYKL